MGTFQTLEEARTVFQGDRFATENGMVIDALTDDSCTCSFVIEARHRNQMDNVMGGAIFTLADFAFAVLSNHLHQPTVAQQTSVNFLSASKGTKLIAHASCKKDGRTTCVMNVDVVDDLGREIAQFIGTGYKL